MSKRARNALLVTVALLAAIVVFVAVLPGQASAGEAKKNPLLEIRNNTRAILDAVTSPVFGLREIKREIQVIEGRSNRVEVMADVDEAACASAPVQCGNGTTGHNSAAASSANHNPVAITVLVTLNGAPVSGLPSSAFGFSNNIVPAGGSAAVLCPAGGSGCASSSLFIDTGDGTYLMWAHPFAANFNWKSGTYQGRINVTMPQGEGTTLVTFTIP
jgi:hypothetical protein